MKRIYYLITLLPSSALALTAGDGANQARPNDVPSQLFKSTPGHPSIFQTISTILIFLVGALAVIMLIYGGLMYVISAGDSKRVETAKNTILYAIIGIVVSVLAFAGVNFVTTSLLR